MKQGIILAGGQGTRLRPLTSIVNKHLLPVYDKPMIYYPIQTLKDMGCTNIIIISGGENIGGFAELLKDGTALDVKITYRVQNEAGGIAEALGCAEGLVSGVFPVILGDNYFEVAPTMPKHPTLFFKAMDYDDANRFGVYDIANKKIVEKPKQFIGNLAVTGLYVYDTSVFGYIHGLEPSDRGELEITDINNFMLKDGAKHIEYKHHWSDMGTFDSLLETANFIAYPPSKIVYA